MRAACTIRRRFPMRKVIVTTGALITQGGAGSTHCEVLPFPEGRLSGATHALDRTQAAVDWFAEQAEGPRLCPGRRACITTAAWPACHHGDRFSRPVGKP